MAGQNDTGLKNTEINFINAVSTGWFMCSAFM